MSFFFIEKLKTRILTKVGDNGRGSDSVSLTVEKFKSMAEMFWIWDAQDGLIKREWKTQFGSFWMITVSGDVVDV